MSRKKISELSTEQRVDLTMALHRYVEAAQKVAEAIARRDRERDKLLDVFEETELDSSEKAAIIGKHGTVVYVAHWKGDTVTVEPVSLA